MAQTQRHTADSSTKVLIEGPCRDVLKGARDPVEDAAAERRKATFSSEELAVFLHDGEDNLKRRYAAPCGAPCDVTIG
jgi:hypothetical protein